MNKCIAFHSYKGGTGKTTLACNSAGVLTRKGYKVCLLDLDVYAPSFQSYFQREPRKGINDFLYSNAEAEDIMLDITDIVSDMIADCGNGTNPSTSSQNNKLKKTGKLWIGFSNPQKKDTFSLEMATNETKRDAIRRFLHLRERLMSDYDADYIIIDTSPGIRFWSINSLAMADVLLLTLKMGDLDIDGTKKVVEEIYRSLTKFGSKAFLVRNIISGYCVPHMFTNTNKNGSSSYRSSPSTLSSSNNNRTIVQLQEEKEESTLDATASLSKEVGLEIVSSIPCYCDIQFLRKEFLTVLKYPQHPFAKQIEQLVEML
jgi:MinD-like ATPase involved in chromosome partitioning or flagellar assembly